MTNVIMEINSTGCHPVAVRKNDGDANRLLLRLVTDQTESAKGVDDYAAYFIVTVEDEDAE